MGKEMNRKTTLALATLLAIALAAYGIMTTRSTANLSDAERLARIDAMFADYRKDFPKAPEITAPEALALAATGDALFVDVRSPAEQTISIIPGSIDQEAYQRDPAQAGERKVIAVCTIGYRSGKFAEEQGGKGHPVLNLSGGILAWTHAGGGLVKAGQPVRRLHVFGSQWNLAPRDIESVW